MSIKRELTFQKIDTPGVNFHTEGVISDLNRRLKKIKICLFPTWLSSITRTLELTYT